MSRRSFSLGVISNSLVAASGEAANIRFVDGPDRIPIVAVSYDFSSDTTPSYFTVMVFLAEYFWLAVRIIIPATTLPYRYTRKLWHGFVPTICRDAIR
jgi:hypothetical protein